MEKEKRIEEMAKIIGCDTCDKDCSNRCAFCSANVKKEAEMLYNAGYRKQEDILHEWVERETAYLNEIAELKKENQRLKETSVWKENEQLKKDLQRKEMLRQKAVLYAEEKHAKNSKLQKQVDELTVRTSELFHELQEEKRAYARAVKDTAKEIISLLEDKDKRGMTVPFSMVLRQLKERYGVEVE